MSHDFMGPGFDGLLVIDKPSGITSREVVNRAQRWFPLRTRIGHTGTLDPLATGVLVLCIGQATRLTEYVQRMSKVYAATVTLGTTSDTDDAEGILTPTPDAKIPLPDEIGDALGQFVGTIDQVPPAFSAARVTGRRAYDLARKGKEVTLAARSVTIYRMDLLRYEYPFVEIVVACSKGTYIRSLARDLGQRLGCGGYITALRRLEVGPFTIADAMKMPATPVEARRRLLPLGRAVCEMQQITLEDSVALRLIQGQRIPLPNALDAADAAIFDDTGRLLAIAEIVDGLLHATKGLADVRTV